MKLTLTALSLIASLAASGTALACKGPSLLFADDFAVMDPTWGIADANASAEGGKFTIRLDPGLYRIVLNQGAVYYNMDACITATVTQGATVGNVYGSFVFWAKDDTDFYELGFDATGSFGVKRWAGRWLYPVRWQASPAIIAGQPNTFRVVTNGTRATIFVNDVEVTSFLGQPPAGGALIGMSANSSGGEAVAVDFADLRITNVP
jgi:hypothetical protein